MPAGIEAGHADARQCPGLAVDGMHLPFDLLPALPALLPVLTAALEELEGGEAAGRAPGGMDGVDPGAAGGGGLAGREAGAAGGCAACGE
jgi:hypothetical protein